MRSNSDLEVEITSDFQGEIGMARAELRIGQGGIGIVFDIDVPDIRDFLRCHSNSGLEVQFTYDLVPNHFGPGYKSLRTWRAELRSKSDFQGGIEFGQVHIENRPGTNLDSLRTWR